MAKYRGRERHLINKLSARYNKDGKNDSAGVGGGDQGAAVAATSSCGDGRAKGGNVVLEDKSFTKAMTGRRRQDHPYQTILTGQTWRRLK